MLLSASKYVHLHFKTKRNHANDERIRSMAAGQAAIEEVINALVHETLESDRDDDLTADQLRILMKKHYTVGGLVDVLSVFGPVNDDVIPFVMTKMRFILRSNVFQFITLGKIAKNRAVSIFRDLKSGQNSQPKNPRPIPSAPSKGLIELCSDKLSFTAPPLI